VGRLFAVAQAWSPPAAFSPAWPQLSHTAGLAPRAAARMGAARPLLNGKLTQLNMAMDVSKDSQLAQLAGMTVLSVDTGDLTIIEELAKTGYITDATTNPLFVSQAGLSGDPRYIAFVDEAVSYAKAEGAALDEDAKVSFPDMCTARQDSLQTEH